MNMSRKVLSTVFVCLMGIAPMQSMAATAATASASTAVEDPAKSFIEGLASEAINALTSDDLERGERIKTFRTLLTANFDVPLIGKWVLGRYWLKASEEQRENYLELFEDYITVTYVERFDQYSNESLKIIKSISAPGKDTLVYTEMHRPNGQGDPININWRVRVRGDVYKIIDIYVEGISMSQTQRREFSSVVRSKGGDLDEFMEVLNHKIVDLSK